MNRTKLYVVEERQRDGEWVPEIWSCRPTRAWARKSKRRADADSDPLTARKRRICIYSRDRVVR